MTRHRFVLVGPDRILVQCLACGDLECVFEAATTAKATRPTNITWNAEGNRLVNGVNQDALKALTVYGVRFNGGNPNMFALGKLGEEPVIGGLAGVYVKAADLIPLLEKP